MEGTHTGLPLQAPFLPSNNKAGARERASERAAHPGHGRRWFLRPADSDSPATLPAPTKELRPQRKDFSGRGASLPRRWRKGVRGRGGAEEQETGTARLPSRAGLCFPHLSCQRLSLYLPAPTRLTGRFAYPGPIHFPTCFVSRYSDTELDSPGSDAPARTTHVQRSGAAEQPRQQEQQGKAGPGHGTQIGTASPDGERRRDLRWPGEGVTRTRSSIGAAVRVMEMSHAVVMGWRGGRQK